MPKDKKHLSFLTSIWVDSFGKTVSHCVVCIWLWQSFATCNRKSTTCINSIIIAELCFLASEKICFSPIFSQLQREGRVWSGHVVILMKCDVFHAMPFYKSYVLQSLMCFLDALCSSKQMSQLESEKRYLEKSNEHLENILEAKTAYKNKELSELNRIHVETIKVSGCWHFKFR